MSEPHPKRHRRSVFLSEEQWAALSEVARAEDRSVNSVVRRLIDSWRTAQPETLVPEPLGPDIRTTDEPVLPALKRIEGGTFHPTKPKTP